MLTFVVGHAYIAMLWPLLDAGPCHSAVTRVRRYADPCIKVAARVKHRPQQDARVSVQCKRSNPCSGGGSTAPASSSSHCGRNSLFVTGSQQ